MVLHAGGNYDEMISGPEATPDEISSPPIQKRGGWVHSHPYLASTIAVGALLFFGIFLFIQRIDVAPSDSSGAWGGAGGLFFNGLRAASQYRPTGADVTKLQSPKQSFSYIPIQSASSNTQETDAMPNEDIMTLLSQLVQSDQNAGTAVQADGTMPDAYSFIPQGLISTDTPVKKRTPAEDALFSYGNEIGTYIKSFEDTHQNLPQILKDHAENRTSAEKTAAVKNLGMDLAQLGRDLLDLTDVPSSASAAHKAYATTYRIVGTNLVKISETASDEEFLNAITAYDTSVEDLTKRFLFLVALFGANNVTFSSSDGGSIFMFSPNLSLLQ